MKRGIFYVDEKVKTEKIADCIDFYLFIYITIWIVYNLI